jgi:CubicO group peptidase (beta-lactamase class C family)
MLPQKKLKKIGIILVIAFILSGFCGGDAPSATVAAATSQYLVRISAAQLNNAGWQADLTFPDCKGRIASNLIGNNMFTFQGYSGQGKMYLTCSNGLKQAEVLINGVAIDIAKACGANGKSFEIDFSKIARNGRNTIQITNFEPVDGKVNVKIPYPTVIAGSAKTVGIDQNKLDAIDLMIRKEIQYGYTSGQLVIVKDGVMIKNTAYGRLNSYNQDGTRKTDSPAVSTTTLYDLASNTKMYATNYALQKLVSEQKIAITDKVTKYFPDFQDSPNDLFKGKANLTVQNLLEHQAGFPAGIHYYDEKFNMKTQKHEPDAHNTLFSQDKQTTLQVVLKTSLQYEPGTKTIYSDVDYMLLGLIVEKVTGMALDSYVEANIYQPLGLKNLVFNPLQKGFTPDDCAATELIGNTREGMKNFKNVRHYTIQGEVHDEKAFYCMGGVSGHAGLFASASDLAKLCQVMLNGGGYGNTKLFDKDVIDNFIKPKFTNATYGLGWRRGGDHGYDSYFGVQSSRHTIGHTGWTGTLTVIDPDSNLVIVWLSNKVNSPLVDKIANKNYFMGNTFVSSIYGAITTMIYDAIENNNPTTFDANISQMVAEKMKLIHNEKNAKMQKYLLNSAYALVDTAVTRAEQSKTKTIISYAKRAVANLIAPRDAEMIREFNRRIAALEKRK